MKLSCRRHAARTLVRTVSSTFDICNKGESPRAIGFIFGIGKLEWLGYNLMKWHHDDRLSRMGAIQQRDRHTQTHRQPRRHNNSRPGGQQKSILILFLHWALRPSYSGVERRLSTFQSTSCTGSPVVTNESE